MKVEIIEVSPRDGIQNEKRILSTETKLELISQAVDAGIRALEVTSFVNPRRVPQMADAEAVAMGLQQSKDIRHIALALNERGFERARAAGITEVNFVVVATETFNRRNQGASVAETMAQLDRISSMARESRIRFGVTIGAAFGCPYEGEVAASRITELAEAIMRSGPAELALADTIGAAAPGDVREKFGMLQGLAGEVPLRCHFHNTRNTGLANALAAVEIGVLRIDSSIGGIGGCPFAPAATGNIPTEDLAYMLDRMGIETGLDTAKLLETAKWLGTQLGIDPPGMLHRAGMFPPPDAGIVGG